MSVERLMHDPQTDDAQATRERGVATNDPAGRHAQGGNRMTRRGVLIAALNAAVAVPVAGAAGYGYARTIEPSWVAIERQHFALPRLHLAFAGYRLVQISDIHADRWMTPERVRDVVRQVNALAPELIVITGDFVTSRPVAPFLAGLVPELRQLTAPDGVFAVMGNHDHWTDPRAVRTALQDAAVRELRNTSSAIVRGAGTLHLAGVDDYWLGRADLAATIASLPADACAILLAHEPDFADVSGPTGRFALQLSGHSHGGQISLPLLGAPILPLFGRKYPRGRYRVGGMIQYTNRGLGMVQPYGRFNCRPEITLITLSPGG